MRMLLKDLQPHSVYVTQLRTRAGERFSDWSRAFEIHTLKDEIAPNPVTNLSGVMNEGNLSLFWEAPTHNSDGTELKDLKDYKVVIGPVPADPEWRLYEFYAESNRAEFPKEVNTASFGKYRASLTISVYARDLVGNLSEAATITKVKARPNPPDGLVWNSVGNAFSGTWGAPSQNTDGSAFTDPAGYDVRVVYDTTNVKAYDIPTNKFDYTYEQNKSDFGGVNNTAKSPLTLEVRARDSVGQLSDPATATAGNPPPVKVTGVTTSQVGDGIRVTWDASPDDDLVAYEIWSAASATAAGTLYGRVSPSQREYTHQTVAYNEDHYLYVTAVDGFSSRSPDSDRSGPIRPKSPFTVDTTAPPATTLTTSTPTDRAATEPAAVKLTWPAVTDSDLAGYHIRFSRNVTPRSWEFHDVIDKTATETTIAGLASDTDYVFQIRSYDTMINTSSWSVEVAGRSTVSEVPPMTEISSDISVITGGVLRSANYDEVAGTGWRLMHSGLDIQSGTVNARVIRAGELRSTQNVTVDGTTQPKWSLNLEGNASLNDVQVRGKIVVGNSAGTANNAVNIASYNYGGSGSQWAIKGDGTIDLKAGGAGANSLQIRNDGIHGFDGAGNERIVLNTAGQFLLATTNGGVRFDDNGIYGYSGATNTFYINRNGAAYFNGQVNAGSGVIGGWNLSINNFYAGNLNLRSDLGMIYGGDTTSRVAMRAGYGFWAGDNDHHLAPFRVSTNGYLYSHSGQIAGFNINGTSGFYGGDNSTRVQMQPGYGFWAGNNVRDNANWYVRQDGYMWARSARVDGTIYATGGQLGSLSVTGTLSGGTISGATVTGGTVQTDGYSYNRVVMGPNANAYTGSTHGISWGGRGWAKMGGSYELELGNYDGLNLTIMRLNANGSYTFQSADSSSGYGLAHGLGIYSQGPYLYDKQIWFRTPGDKNHRIGFGGGLGDGTQVWGYSHFGVTINAYSPDVSALRVNSAANLYVGGTGNFSQSTIKGKKNVRGMDKSHGVAKVKKMNPVFYDRLDETASNVSGVIAEEVIEYAPELVMLDEETNEPIAVNYAGFTPYLIKAIQELTEEVEALKARLPARPTA